MAFARLAADSALAPTIEQRLELSRFASAAVERRDRVLARITEIGGDPVAAVRQYDDVLDDFDARTQPGSWWERLLKAYVGYGVADDFCRLAAEGLDEGSRAVVLEVLDDASHAELAVAELDAAGPRTACSPPGSRCGAGGWSARRSAWCSGSWCSVPPWCGSSRSGPRTSPRARTQPRRTHPPSSSAS